ncbi:hypothetical protein [Aeromicrobium sp. UC242_57]|uniref:hypothetical protein n=1 Tax=Aeromicrobium sp. UC242_57 TaxID=3374624 RepID=UPI00379619A0
MTNLRPEHALERAGSVGHPWFMNEVKPSTTTASRSPPGCPASCTHALPCCSVATSRTSRPPRRATTPTDSSRSATSQSATSRDSSRSSTARRT